MSQVFSGEWVAMISVGGETFPEPSTSFDPQRVTHVACALWGGGAESRSLRTSNPIDLPRFATLPGLQATASYPGSANLRGVYLPTLKIVSTLPRSS